MTEVLLRELTNREIDWMIEEGARAELPVGTALVSQGEVLNDLHILLEGSLSFSLVHQDEENVLARALDVLSGTNEGRELFRLTSGQMVGDVPLTHARPSLGNCKAIEASQVLSIPRRSLESKLQEDEEFGAHFYRVMAILLAERWEQMVAEPAGRVSQGSFNKDALFVFGQFTDQDLDWLVAIGQRETLPQGTILIQGGRPIDALYIVIRGKFTVLVPEEDNLLVQAFQAFSDTQQASLGKAIGAMGEGDLIGETMFVNGKPPTITVQAIEDALVLSVPRQQLTVKLQQDYGFASRFYRAVALLLSDRLRSLISRVGFGRRTYSASELLDQETPSEEELNPDLEDQIYLAGTRFRWLLQQLRSQL